MVDPLSLPAAQRAQAVHTYNSTGPGKNKYPKTTNRKRPDWDEVHKQDFIMRNFDWIANRIYNHFAANSGSSLYTPYKHITSLRQAPGASSAKDTLGDMTMGIFPFLGTSGFDAYVEMPNKVWSSLVPFAKVSKVTQRGSKSETVEMQMASHLGVELNQFGTTIEQVMRDRTGRGYGGGIQQLDIEMSGSNIASAKRMYDIKIQYFFSSMAEMFETRKDPVSNTEYQFSDLISKSAHPYEATSDRCDRIKNKKGKGTKEGTKLMLEFGYAELDKNIVPYAGKKGKSDIARTLIKDTAQVVFLNLYKHKVDLKENGTLVVTAEYHGYVEESKNRIDVLSLMAAGQSTKRMNKIKELEYDLCRYRSETKNKTAGGASGGKETEYEERKREEIEKKEEKLKDLRSKAYSYILDQLYNRNQIFGCKLETNNVEPYTLKFKKIPKLYHSHEDYLTDLKETAKEDRLRGGGGIDRSGSTWSKISTFGGMTGNTTEGILRWVYLGSILEIIYELAHKIDPDIQLLLGGIYHYPEKPENKSSALDLYPLAQFPIAMEAFAEWWHHHVLQKGERQRYFLMDFLRDITTGLISGCYEIANFGEKDRDTLPVLPATTFAINSFQTPKPVPRGRRSYIGAAISAEAVETGYSTSSLGRKSTRNSSGNIGRKEAKKNANLLLYANQPPFYQGEKRGTSASDAMRGIWHLRGSNLEGVVRSVKFSHADAKFGTESRMINNGMSSIEASMWGFYNANVELYGCTSFYPGAMVRVSSAEFEPKEADKIGLGGYYRILKVKHKIRQGSFITELECQWEAKGVQ